MDAFSRLLNQIMSRLGDVTPSQRIALLLGAALVTLAIFWLGQWAAKPELTPLLEQDLQPEEIARIRDGLRSMGETSETRGQRIYVSASANRQALLAALQMQERLPSNTSAGFNALVKQSDPWISQAENDRRWTVGLQHELERVLGRFQGVREARVFLNLNPNRRGFSRVESAGSASVTLIMGSGERVPRELALAAARLISGAVRGLALQNVQVVDASGVSALDWETDDTVSSHLQRLRVQHEKRIADRIRSQLPDPKARVAVQVELETTTRDATTVTPIAGVSTSEETTSEKTLRSRRANQPGVQPNTAMEVGAGGALPDETNERETNRTQLQPGQSARKESTPPGDIKEVSAAINISHSYLTGIFVLANPGQTPNEAQLQEVFDREKKRFISLVSKLVKPQKEDHVAIEWYYDTTEAPTVVQASAVDDAIGMARKYGPQAGLGLLAVMALFMMMRMAKRGDQSETLGLQLGLPKEAIDAARRAAQDVARQAGKRPAGVAGTTDVAGGGGTSAGGALADIETFSAGPVGRAAMTEGVLVAQEVDEKTVQTHKMVEQVAQMVTADPDGVSNLIEQWISRHEVYRG